MRDVATRAGVSVKTVSRVVNREPHIRPETRAQVHTAEEPAPLEVIPVFRRDGALADLPRL